MFETTNQMMIHATGVLECSTETSLNHTREPRQTWKSSSLARETTWVLGSTHCPPFFGGPCRAGCGSSRVHRCTEANDRHHTPYQSQTAAARRSCRWQKLDGRAVANPGSRRIAMDSIWFWQWRRFAIPYLHGSLNVPIEHHPTIRFH